MEFSMIGKSPVRIDALEKVTGEAKYCSDLLLDSKNLLHVKLLGSPYPHARIKKIDTSKAEGIPGVEVIVTGKDPLNNLYGQWQFAHDRYVLARDTVRFTGEPVAAVAADSADVAKKALALISVEYEELPAVFDPEEAWGSNPKVVVHPDFWQYKMDDESRINLSSLNMPNVISYYKVQTGDIKRGFQESDLIIENRFSAARVMHAQLEPECCIAQMGNDGILTMWVSRRVVYRVKALICDIFNLLPSQVRIIQPYVGGAFGRFPHIEPIAALIALKTNRPVRLALSREEDLQASSCNPPIVIYLKDGVKKDGTLVAREMKTIIDGGAYADIGPVLTKGNASGAVASYRVPNFRIDSYLVYTNSMPATTMRGIGTQNITYAIEVHMDIIREKLGLNPIDFRKDNLLKEGEKNSHGEITHSIGVAECLDKAAELMEWHREPEKDKGVWRRGKGLAIGGMPVDGYGISPSAAHIRVHEDGVLELRHSTDEVGQGINTILAQIVAEEFSVPLDKIRIVRSDTIITPFDGGAAAQRSTFCLGNATWQACQDAKRQICELAAPILQVFPYELEVADNKVFIAVKGKYSEAITIPELFLHSPLAAGGQIIGVGRYIHRATALNPETGQAERIHPAYSHGAHAVEVAVNVETGEVKVLRVGAAFDAGQPINPKLVEGQIEGGLAMGIGFALYEEILMKSGKVVNPNFKQYRVPRTVQVPTGLNIKSAIVIMPHREGPYGAKGLGETVLVPIIAAIGNAIYDAVGVRIWDIPITPKRLLRSLKGNRDYAR